MDDLLKQAITRMFPLEYEQCSRYLAFIQNSRNMQHQTFCDTPAADLSYALHRLHQQETELARFYWDNDWTVRGLS